MSRCTRCGYQKDTRIHQLNGTHPGRHRYDPEPRDNRRVVLAYLVGAGAAVVVGAILALL